LLVYDITDGDSFKRVREWVKELRKVVGPSIKLAIAGNKCDLVSKRHVTQEEAESYANEVGATHTLTSAKSGSGLVDVFQALTKSMASAPPKDGAAGGTGSRRNARRGRQKLTLVDSDEEEAKPKSGCC
jgi:Ras-related protein Rab-21